jgi:type I restriction enzyme S subunit
VGEGDFVYNRLFAWKGSFAIATQENHGCYVSNEFPCFAVEREHLDGRYLWHYFSRAAAWNEALGLSSGGTPTSRNRLKEVRLLAMRIPLPPLEEQRRIVARIEELVAKVEAAQALRQEATAAVENLVVGVHVEFAASRVVSLGDILVLDEIKEDVLPGRQYTQVGIKSFGQGLFAKEAVDASQTGYRFFHHLYEGAVVLSQVKGWEGAVAVCDPDLAGLYVSPEYRTFRCIPGMVLPEYLAQLVVTSWFYSRLADATRGVGARRQRTRPELFLELRMPMPAIEQQQRAIPIFDSARIIRQHQAATAAALDALLPSILDRAFKGEL